MAAKHFTLTTRSNIVFIILWLVVVAISLFISEPKPLVTILVGMLFGIPCGILQNQSLSENAGAFLAAGSALDVRKVLVSGKSGKRALQLQWLGGGIIFISSLIQKTNPVLGVLSGYCTLMMFRDVITLKAVSQLNK